MGLFGPITTQEEHPAPYIEVTKHGVRFGMEILEPRPQFAFAWIR
jgi:hypothetical protein